MDDDPRPYRLSFLIEYRAAMSEAEAQQHLERDLGFLRSFFGYAKITAYAEPDPPADE